MIPVLQRSMPSQSTATDWPRETSIKPEKYQLKIMVLLLLSVAVGVSVGVAVAVDVASCWRTVSQLRSVINKYSLLSHCLQGVGVVMCAFLLLLCKQRRGEKCGVSLEKIDKCFSSMANKSLIQCWSYDRPARIQAEQSWHKTRNFRQGKLVFRPNQSLVN